VSSKQKKIVVTVPVVDVAANELISLDFQDRVLVED
jgi:hypothetical protein